MPCLACPGQRISGFSFCPEGFFFVQRAFFCPERFSLCLEGVWQSHVAGSTMAYTYATLVGPGQIVAHTCCCQSLGMFVAGLRNRPQYAWIVAGLRNSSQYAWINNCLALADFAWCGLQWLASRVLAKGLLPEPGRLLLCPDGLFFAQMDFFCPECHSESLWCAFQIIRSWAQIFSSWVSFGTEIARFARSPRLFF